MTKLDSVNQQFVPFEVVSQPPEAMYKLAECSKSSFVIVAARQNLVFFSKKNGILFH